MRLSRSYSWRRTGRGEINFASKFTVPRRWIDKNKKFPYHSELEQEKRLLTSSHHKPFLTFQRVLINFYHLFLPPEMRMRKLSHQRSLLSGNEKGEKKGKLAFYGWRNRRGKSKILKTQEGSSDFGGFSFQARLFYPSSFVSRFRSRKKVIHWNIERCFAVLEAIIFSTSVEAAPQIMPTSSWKMLSFGTEFFSSSRDSSSNRIINKWTWHKYRFADDAEAIHPRDICSLFNPPPPASGLGHLKWFRYEPDCEILVKTFSGAWNRQQQRKDP